jgi:hypothetical protein
VANIDLTSLNPVLKELYDDQKVLNEVYKTNPTLAMMPKMTDAGGKYYPQPVQIGVSQGRSSSFSTAQTNQTSATFREYLVTLASDYSLATLDNKTLLSARTDRQAFVNAAKVQVDGAIRSIKNSLGSALFRSGTGSIGQISSISTGVITLASALDVVQFEIGMVIQANATDGGTPRAALGYVISVDRSAGTVTVSASLGGSAGSPASWAASDYLLVQGDVNAKITGLAGWLPFTAPTSGDSFFGVDRSIDTVRLAGNRKDASNQSIEEGLQDFLTQIAINDGAPDYFITNPNSYVALQKALGSKAQIVELAAEMGKDYRAVVGFKALEIQMSGMTVKVLQDRNCPAQFGYALQMDTWKMISLGDAPQILTYGAEGLEVLRVSNADAAELRVGYYANLVCNAPAYNGVIKLSA